MHSTSFPTIVDLTCVVPCICVVLVVVGVMIRQRAHKNTKEVLSTSEDSYADIAAAAEVANPVCKI
jgi:hypothetical protein